jgi:hypothetical protein
VHLYIQNTGHPHCEGSIGHGPMEIPLARENGKTLSEIVQPISTKILSSLLP